MKSLIFIFLCQLTAGAAEVRYSGGLAGSGAFLTGVVKSTGDTMSGTLNGTRLNLSDTLTVVGSATIQGNAFSVGGSTLVISQGIATFTGTDGVLRVNSPVNNNYTGLQFQELGLAKAEINYLGSGYVTAGRQKALEIVGASNGDITLWPNSTMSANFHRTGHVSFMDGLTITSTMTVTGNALSVGVSTFVVKSGSVAIGTTDPAQKLHLSSGTLLIDGNVPTAISISNTNPRISIMATTGTNPNYMTLTNTGGVTYMGLENSAASEFGGGVAAYSSIFGSGQATPVHFLTTALPRMTITAAGNVGISTTTPAAALSVVAGSGAEYALIVSSANGTRALGIHANGHFSLYGSSVSVATCTNGTVVANSRRDTAFAVSFGGSNSSCGISFGEPYDITPVCVCTTQNTGNNGCELSQLSVSSATFKPETGSWASGDRLNVICLAPH